jgi:hypothetical protein
MDFVQRIKEWATNNKITQLEVSTILANNAVSVGNRILSFQGNVVSPSWTFRPLKTKTSMLPRNVGIRLPSDCVVSQFNGRLSYIGAKTSKFPQRYFSVF